MEAREERGRWRRPLAALAGMALLALGLLWIARLGERGATSPEGRSADALRNEPARDETVADVPSVIPRATRSASAPTEAEEAPSASRSTAPSTPLPPRPVLLDGRVVDDEGRPVPDAEAWLWAARDELPERIARGDADGLLAGSFHPPPPHRPLGLAALGFPERPLEIRAPGFASGWLSLPVDARDREQAVHLGTIRLTRGGEVHGLVLFADRRPAAGAEVFWGFADEFPEGPLRVGALEIELRREPRERPTLTDAEGRFALLVPYGERFLAARARGTEATWTERFLVGPGGVPEPLLVLPPATRRLLELKGRVLTPDRRPAAGVEVQLDSGFLGLDAAEETDASGTFAFPIEVEAGQRFRLVARDPQRRGLPVELTELNPDAGPFELVLGAARPLEVLLRDARGRGVAWGHVRVHGVSAEVSWDDELFSAGEGGRATLLRPRVAFRLEAMAPGFRTQTFGPFEPSSVSDPLVLVLTAGQTVRGRVTSAGRPLAGARVGVQATLEPGQLRRSSSLAPLDDPFVSLALPPRPPEDATTAADGTFTCTLHRGGPNQVVVAAPGFPTTVFGPYVWDKEAGAEGLELALLPAGAIEGRLLVAAGESAAERLIGASDGHGAAWTSLTDGEGRYRIEGLPPGSYQVRECTPPAASYQAFAMRWDEDVRLDWDGNVRPGATMRFDVDRRHARAVILVGHLALPGTISPSDGDRVPPRANLYRSRGPNRAPVASASFDAAGDFELVLSEGGLLTLAVGGFEQALELLPGRNEWSPEIRWGVVRVSPLDTDSVGWMSVVLDWHAPDGLGYTLQAWLSRNRPVELPFPAGEANARLQSLDSTLREYSLTVRAGETTELSLEPPR